MEKTKNCPHCGKEIKAKKDKLKKKNGNRGAVFATVIVTIITYLVFKFILQS